MPTNNRLEKQLFGAAKLRISGIRVATAKRSKTYDAALLELPQILDWLACSVANGDSIYRGLIEVSELATGQLAQALRRLVLRLEYGETLEEAIRQLQSETNSASVAEFANKLMLALRRGTPVASQLKSLAQSCRAALKVALLAKASANELKMLIPLVFLILPVTIWFAVLPSLQMLQLGF